LLYNLPAGQSDFLHTHKLKEAVYHLAVNIFAGC
jgi:hypothetical protein